MSINKEILYRKVEQTLLKYAKRKDADGIMWKDKLDYEMILYLAKAIVFNDARTNCNIKGSRYDWYGLPRNKSLFFSPENCGLPIGNLTSQLL